MEYIASVYNWIASVSSWILPFLILLTVLVFVHEMGHYLVARYCGVRVEVFSVGFGPEIYGWNDSRGTRWRFSLIPIGGYVKMFGEQPGGPGRDGEGPALSAAERAESFAAKTLGQRSAIVFAGPFANFVFAIVVMAGMFMAVGQLFTPADIGVVEPNSAAERAGLKPGDVIAAINGTEIERFEQIVNIVRPAAGPQGDSALGDDLEEPVDVGRAVGGDQFEIGDNRPSDGYPTHRTTVDAGHVDDAIIQSPQLQIRAQHVLLAFASHSVE